MQYQNIITDICSQIGDPSKDKYEERAKDHFLRAIFELIDNDRFTLDDIPGYVKYKTDLTFTADEFDLTTITCYKIFDVLMPPGTATDFTVTLKKPTQLGRISANDELQPTDNEIFVFRIGNTLHLLTSSTTNYDGENLALVYMEDIDPSSWTDTTELTSGNFSQSFVRSAATLAVQTLQKEDIANQ